MNRPDLSGLPRDVRVRIAVAETQGAMWQAARNCPVLRRLDGFILYSFGMSWEDGECLPRYLTDPAAWGALEEAERVEVWYNGGLVHARCAVDPRPECSIADRRSEAVCRAVLAKHGVDWLTLEPVS